MEAADTPKKSRIPFRWLFTWKVARRILIGLASVATLIVLFYAVENWRGRHALNQYKAELKSRGETLILMEIAPPMIPDDQNMAMSPLWRGLFNMEKDTNSGRLFLHEVGPFTNHALVIEKALSLDDEQFNAGNWKIGEKTPLRELQEYYRRANREKKYEFPTSPQPQSPGEDILLAMSRHDAILEMIRESAQRPFCRFPINYERGYSALLPHLARLKGASQVLEMRGVAELSINQTDKALDDLQLAFRLSDSIRKEPVLISHLVGIYMNNQSLQVVWEGLADHRWSDEQLVALERTMSGMNYLKDFQLCIQGERTLLASAVENAFAQGGLTPDLDVLGISSEFLKMPYSENESRDAIIRCFPRGWYEQNVVLFSKLISKSLSTIDIEHGRLQVDLSEQVGKELGEAQRTPSPYSIFAIQYIPAMNRASLKFAMAQSYLNMARIACGLERYRLAHGHYPEKQEAISPQFMASIPNDVITGKPLIYRLNSDGTFILYSVGWNQKDEGGSVSLPKKKYTQPDWSQGDWVWRY